MTKFVTHFERHSLATAATPRAGAGGDGGIDFPIDFDGMKNPPRSQKFTYDNQNAVDWRGDILRILSTASVQSKIIPERFCKSTPGDDSFTLFGVFLSFFGDCYVMGLEIY